jgi:hypothetical protein
VSAAAENTSHGANDTRKAAQELVRIVHQLRRLIERFKIQDGLNDLVADQSRTGRARQ